MESLQQEPVSRICRYDLIIGDTLKLTENIHPDYKNLEKVAKAVKDSVIKINDKMKDFKK